MVSTIHDLNTVHDRIRIPERYVEKRHFEVFCPFNACLEHILHASRNNNRNMYKGRL